MKFKFDENLDRWLFPLVVEAGHEVDTVRDEGLCGSSDEVVYQTCVATQRVLITLDLDFSNPLRFPPAPTEGIVVLCPNRPTLPSIRATMARVLPFQMSKSLKGKLWIAEPTRLRVYDPEGANEGFD